MKGTVLSENNGVQGSYHIFKWIDYCKEYENEINVWSQDGLSLRYATDENNGIKEIYEHWLHEEGSTHNEKFFCKIVLYENQPVAVLIMLTGNGHPMHINPIIVNPDLRNQGYCTRIIKELLEHANKILAIDVKYFTAGIDMDNTGSIRAFEKAGFVLAGKHVDRDFAYWVYPASEIENYRTYCINSMDDEFIVVPTVYYSK